MICSARRCGKRFISLGKCPNHEQHLEKDEYPVLISGTMILAYSDRDPSRFPRILWMDVEKVFPMYYQRFMKKVHKWVRRLTS